MRALRFEHTSELPVAAERVWEYHLAPRALERLSPPFPPVRIADGGEGVSVGSEVVLELGLRPFTVSWRALHSTVAPPRVFVDVALEAPFRFWVYQHVVEPLGTTRSRLRDVVHFLPAGPLPLFLAGPLARLALRVLFRWRHRRTRSDLIRASGRTVPRRPVVASL